MLFFKTVLFLTHLLGVVSSLPPPSTFCKGHDLSSLLTLEEAGAVYKDTKRNNKTRPAEAILKDGGMNGVRLRLWVDPAEGTNGLNYTIKLAQRFQQGGLKIYLDFHFSDYWADPTKQYPPAAWPTALEPLATTLRTYVKSTLISFHRAGITLSFVSLGNEIRHGMLWPLGYVSVDPSPLPALYQNFSQLATLYSAARAGVTDAVLLHNVPKPEVMIHIDDGWNLTLQERWFDALTANHVPLSAWDVFGFSFYPFYGTAATFAALSETLNALALKYGKPLHVVETDYPAICNGEYEPIPESSEPEIPYDVKGQTGWVESVVGVVRGVERGLGRGMWYWEPAWLNNTSLGSNCSDAILFEGDYSENPAGVGYSRSSVNFFRE